MPASSLHQQIDRSLRIAVGMATEYVLDAAREVATEVGRPVMVIASRRQIESIDAGGGYVGLSTPEWCARARSGGTSGEATGHVLLARDHGGPYQHPRDLSGVVAPSTAMKAAAESFRWDIESGVDLIHIDTSLGVDGLGEDPHTACERALELATGCAEVAASTGRPIAYEVGIEVQDTSIADAQEYADQMDDLLGRLRRECAISPAFLVAQTGTKVFQRTNRGVLQRRPELLRNQRSLRNLGSVVGSLGSRLKAHNCDYLDDQAVRELHRAGAWMNVSPELGVAQTIAVLEAARGAKLGDPLDAFCEATITAGYWRKWTGDDPAVPDDEKVMLGGSYLFAAPVFAELRQRLDHALRPQGRSTARIAIDAVKAVMRRYDRG